MSLIWRVQWMDVFGLWGLAPCGMGCWNNSGGRLAVQFILVGARAVVFPL